MHQLPALPGAAPEGPPDTGSSSTTESGDGGIDSSLFDQEHPSLPVIRRIHGLLAALVGGAALYTCYLASDLLLPVFLAGFLALLLSPINARLCRRFLPRWLTALFLVLCLIAGLSAIGMFLYGPAVTWAHRAPALFAQTAPKLQSMLKPLREATKAGDSLDSIASGSPVKAPLLVDASSHASWLYSTPRFLASFIAVVLLSYFFLLYGEQMLRKAMTLGSTRSNKKITLDIVRSIQSDLSRYVLTVCGTSAMLGLATGVFLWWRGVEDPVLWGTLAALLNLTPYVGPLITAALLLMVGLSEFHGIGQAAVPAAGFLGLHLLESQVVTPQALGKTFQVSPLAIILWLMLWGWLWGILGLLLAVPMLVCLKVVFSRIDSLRTWTLLIEE